MSIYFLRLFTGIFKSRFSICRAKKGYTNNQLGVSWIKNFHDQTKNKADSRRVLYLDVHRSHYTGEFLDFAQEHNILVMGYFPHCTAVMQGLDVACFGALKINYGNEKVDFEGRTGEEANGGNFLQIYAPAYRKTFTEQTIRTAFRKTGLIPFNRDVIDPVKLAPAKELSVIGTFPIRQPSPVSAVLDAFHKVRTACDKENSGACPTSSWDRQTSPRRPLASRENTTSSTLTPCVNRMMDGLASTSASFLVGDDNPFSSACRIPPPFFPRLPEGPTWDMILRSPRGPRSKEDLENENRILRSTMRDQRNRTKQGEEIISAQNAQLVLQNMYALFSCNCCPAYTVRLRRTIWVWRN